MSDYTLPETLPFARTFKCVLQNVVENGYHDIDAGSPEDIRFVYDGDKEAFDATLANAIEETCSILGVGEAAGAETGDWLVELYDLAAELGYTWEDAK